MQQIDTNNIRKWLKEYFGITPEGIKELPGETDQNFRILHSGNRQYLLKVGYPGKETDAVRFEQAMAHYLIQQGFPYAVPEPVLTIDGNPMVTVDTSEGRRILTLQTWVDGYMLAGANPRDKKLLRQWGEVCGHLMETLKGFDDPFAHRNYKWDPSRALQAKPLLEYITDGKRHHLASAFWEYFEDETRTGLQQLPMGVNYNDAHEHNLLIDRQDISPRIIGLVDFGDAVYTHRINELAIACAYAGQGFTDPLEPVLEVIKGCCRITKISEEEASLLYPMIIGRLLLTTHHAAENRRLHPENEYLTVSEELAWKALEGFAKRPARFIKYAIRNAAGFEAYPDIKRYEEWLRKNRKSLTPPVSEGNGKPVPVPLGMTSELTVADLSGELSQWLGENISSYIRHQGGTSGYGGYGEVRPFYSTHQFAEEGNWGKVWRTVHLGIDLWHPAGTPVTTPLDGIVESVADNRGAGDYGPTLILKHQPQKGLCFYTLYGHLNPQVLNRLKPGQTVTAGETIAHLGNPEVNGGWPPHLHFQIILDLLGYHGDFPGVAPPDEQDIWKMLSPDPTEWFEEFRSASNSLPYKKELLRKRQSLLGPNLSLSYSNPLYIVRGSGARLFDQNGKAYLDTVNNVAHVGHEHPAVVEAIRRQAKILNTNTRYLHHQIIETAEMILQRLPDHLKVVYLVNSGSEANELAMRMAQAVTGNNRMLVLENGYHGNTAGCIRVSSYKFDRKGGQGASEGVYVLPMPDPFRGIYAGKADAAALYAGHAETILQTLRSEGKGPANLIHETILSCGGQIVPPEGYFSTLYDVVYRAGGICIADEVQHGFGRTGSHFSAFEAEGIKPDIVTMGKPAGNGHPVGIVACTRRVAEAFNNGMEYFNTFGGNPVSAAAVRAVMNVIDEEGLMGNALKTGNYLTDKLKELSTGHPIIADVRGRGLFIGFEMIHPVTRKPATREASRLANRMRCHGVLMSTDGPDENVLKIKPPLSFGIQEADYFLDMLQKVLQENIFHPESYSNRNW
ncbi:MAG: aminotransferase class III-fold pyridoxal phosphate-dependent enzyme [Bacteroidales bacterium]